MRNIYLIVIGFFLLCSFSMRAQVANYTWSQITGMPYDTIVGGTSLGSVVNTQTFADKLIGFTFSYNGVPYTTFSVGTDGYVTLGSAASTIQNVIYAFNADLEGIQISKLSYKTVYAAPDTMCIIEWRNFKRFGNNYVGDNYNFQIRFHKKTNIIDVIYGAMKNTPTTTGTVKVGLIGPDTTDFNKRSTLSNTTADWSSTANDVTGTGTCYLYDLATTSIAPSLGLTFIWTPATPPMKYVFSTVVQSDTTNVVRGTKNAVVACIQVIATGVSDTLHLTSLKLSRKVPLANFNNNVSGVQVYYTGTRNVFDSTKLFGSSIDMGTPITGNIKIYGGKNINYFWIVYDITPTASLGAKIDAACSEIILSTATEEKTYTPLITDPPEFRRVLFNYWTRRKDIPRPGGNISEVSGYGVSIGNKGYCAGLLYPSSAQQQFFEYDPELNTWTGKKDCPVLIWKAIGFSIGNKGYIYSTDGVYFYEYDQDEDAWTAKTKIGIPLAGFAIGGKGYIATNDAGSRIYEYDPVKNTWKYKLKLSNSNESKILGFSIGTKGYFNFADTALYEYDPGKNSLVRKADFRGTKRTKAVSFSISDKGYIGTGTSGTSSTIFLSDFWEYNPRIDTWTLRPRLSGLGRHSAAGFSIGFDGYIGMGDTVDAGGTSDRPFREDFYQFKQFDTLWVKVGAQFSALTTTPCLGDAVAFTDESTGPVLSWQWSFPGGTPEVSAERNPTVVYNSPGIYPVTLMVINEYVDSTTVKTGYIEVKEPPLAVIEKGGSTHCATRLNASQSTPGSGIIERYLWYRNDTLVFTGLEGNPIYDAPDSGAYYVIVRNSFGCMAQSGVVAVTEQHVSLTARINGGSVSCNGNSIMLYDTLSTAGQGIITGHQWQRDGVVLNGATHDSCAVTKEGYYTVIVTNSAGCSAISSPWSVYFGKPPEVNLGGNQIICGAIELDAGSGFAQYLWSTGATTRKINVSQTSDYAVTVTNAAGCRASDTVQIIYKGLNATIIMPDTVIMNSDVHCSSSSINGLVWQWKFGDGGSSQQPDTIYRYQKSGVYIVKLIVSNDYCSDTVKKKIVVRATGSVSEEAMSKVGTVNVYPNPSAGKFMVDVILPFEDKVTIKVVDALGALMYLENTSVKEYINRELDLRKYAKGIYYIHVETSKGAIVKKVSVQ